MVRRELIVAAMALLFGATAAYESTKLPFGTIHSPGPGFFPWWTSILIVLLALVLLVQVLTSRSAAAAAEGFGRIAKVVALLIVLAAYTFLLDLVGYPLCTFFLVLFMLRVTDPQPWAIAVGVAGITAVGSYTVFAMWLSVPLPRGPL